MKRRLVILSLAGALLAPGIFLLGQQGWRYFKAQLAETLIIQAFTAHMKDGLPHKPWSWADMHPIARLEVPRLGIGRNILTGASGTSMAFGLGHIDGTSLPNRQGNCVLAGHRDSWFRFLKELRLGDGLQLTTREGYRRYTVKEIAVVSHKNVGILAPIAGSRLTLVTCYPFSGLLSGPWRYVVICEPVRTASAAMTV